MTLLCTKYYQNWSMNVEDIVNQSSVIFWAWLRRPIFGVHDSQGSAETLVRRGRVTNYHLIAYSFGNIFAKNYQNRLMCIEVIARNVSVVFRHSENRATNAMQWLRIGMGRHTYTDGTRLHVRSFHQGRRLTVSSLSTCLQLPPALGLDMAQCAIPL